MNTCPMTVLVLFSTVMTIPAAVNTTKLFVPASLTYQCEYSEQGNAASSDHVEFRLSLSFYCETADAADR